MAGTVEDAIVVYVNYRHQRRYWSVGCLWSTRSARYKEGGQQNTNLVPPSSSFSIIDTLYSQHPATKAAQKWRLKLW